MNFFELINMCLYELNMKQIINFEEPDSDNLAEIKQIINNINIRICKTCLNNNYFFSANEHGKYCKEMFMPADKSIIPYGLGDKIIIYGACVEYTRNPWHSKFAYWLNNYYDGINLLNEFIRNLK